MRNQRGPEGRDNMNDALRGGGPSIPRWRTRLVGGAMTVLLTVAASLTMPAPASTQDEPASCRCVDADGNPIEACTCLRVPGFDVPRALALFSDQRPRLGITLDVSPSPDAGVDGAHVAGVLEGGPAAEAGIREGDIVTHVDGRSLSEPIGADRERDFDPDGSVPAQRLLALVGELEPGESVEIAYVRDGRQQTTVVEAAELGDRLFQRGLLGARGWNPARDGDRIRAWDQTRIWDQPRLRGQLERLGDGARTWTIHPDPGSDAGVFVFGGGRLGGGLGMVEVGPGLGEYFGTDRGVLITEVEGDSVAGLEAGDVVLAVDGREVTTPERLRRILASYGSDEAAELRVLRRGNEITVTAPMR